MARNVMAMLALALLSGVAEAADECVPRVLAEMGQYSMNYTGTAYSGVRQDEQSPQAPALPFSMWGIASFRDDGRFPIQTVDDLPTFDLSTAYWWYGADDGYAGKQLGGPIQGAYRIDPTWGGGCVVNIYFGGPNGDGHHLVGFILYGRQVIQLTATEYSLGAGVLLRP